VWFFASFGFGIIFRKHLDALSFGGFKLGFWFAQNGAIFAFIALIFIYVRLMNSLDKEYDVDE
jgi:putative solute:sodium symporter small subunit